VNCLFLEAGPTFQPAIDAYMNGQGSYGGILEENYKLTQLFGYEASNLLPQGLLDAAQAQGLKVRAMDINFLGPEAKEGLDILTEIQNLKNPTKEQVMELLKRHAKVNIEGRSRIMSQSIARDMKNGTCTQSMVVVGSAHIGEQYTGFATGLHTLLKDEQGITPQVLNVVDPSWGCQSEELSESLCKAIAAGPAVPLGQTKDINPDYSAVFYAK
jgi:hypothetical protein